MILEEEKEYRCWIETCLWIIMSLGHCDVLLKERKRSSIERRKKGRRKLLEKNVRFWNYKFIISITMDKLYVTIYLYIYQHMFFLSSFSSFLFFCLFHFIQTFLGDIQARWKSRAALFIHSNNKPVVQISLFLTSNLLQSISSINYNPNLNWGLILFLKLIPNWIWTNFSFTNLHHDNNDIIIDLTDIFGDSI